MKKLTFFICLLLVAVFVQPVFADPTPTPTPNVKTDKELPTNPTEPPGDPEEKKDEEKKETGEEKPGEGETENCSVVIALSPGKSGAGRDAGVGTGALAVKQLQSSTNIAKPTTVSYTAPLNSKVSNVKTSDLPYGVAKEVTLTSANSQPITYQFKGTSTVGVPIGKYAYSATKLEDTGSSTYKKVDLNGGAINFNSSGVAANYTAGNGRTVSLTTDGVEQEVLNTGGGTLRQIKTLGGLTDVVPVNDYKYEVRFFGRTVAGSKDGSGFFVPTGSAHTVWKVENPDASPSVYNKTKVTKTIGGRAVVTNYEQNTSTKNWTMTKGSASTVKHITTKTLALNPAKTERTMTWEYKNGSNVVASKVIHKSKSFDWGESIVEKILDPDGANLKTTFSYFNGNNKVIKGKVKSEVKPTGGFKVYSYDNKGRQTRLTTPFKSSAIDSTSSRAEIKKYESLDPTDTVSNTDLRPRTVLHKVGGIFVKRTFNVYKQESGEQKHITARPLPGEENYGANNLKRIESYYLMSDSTVANRGRLKSVQEENGNIVTYSYSFDTTGGRKIFVCEKIEKAVGYSNGVANKTLKTITKEDELGNEIYVAKYVYTGGSSYSLMTKTEREFDEMGKLTSVEVDDELIYEATWTDGLLTSEINEEGIETTHTYDEVERLVTSTKEGVDSEEDIVTTYTYDGNNNLLSYTISGGSLSYATSYEYDLANRMTKETKPGGYETTWAYSSGGKIKTKTFPGGATEITEYYADERLKSITGTAVVAKYYDYGANSNGSMYTYEYIGSSNSYRYTKTTRDTLGNIIEICKSTGMGDFTITYTYNNKNQLVKKTETDLADELYEYDEVGRVCRQGLDIDGNGILSTNSTDRIVDTVTSYTTSGGNWYAQVEKKVYHTDNSTSYTSLISKSKINGMDRETWIPDAMGNTTKTFVEYDRDNHTRTESIEITGAQNPGVKTYVNGLIRTLTTPTIQEETTYQYDDVGRIIEVTNPRTGTVETVYDATSGLVTSVTDAAGKETEYEYYTNSHLNAGRIKKITAPEGEITYFEYTARGQISRQWGSNSYPVEYEYSSAYGELTKQKTFRAGSGWTGSSWPGSSGADVTEWVYNAISGLLWKKIFPDTSDIVYSYTVRGKVATRTWERTSGGNPLVTTYSYDPDTAELLSINYSDSTPDLTYAYTRTGRVKSVDDAVGHRDFTYSDLKPSTETTSGGGALYSKRITRKYDTFGSGGTYYSGFQVGTTVDPDADYDTTFYLDDDARLERMTGPGLPAYGAVYSYVDDSDLIEKIEYKSDGSTVVATITNSYEANRNIRNQVQNKVGSTVVSQYDYAYDGNRRRTSVINTGTAFSASAFNLYDYNDRSEITVSDRYLGTDIGNTSSPVSAQAYDYAYDNIGNRSSSAVAGGSATTYTANSLNQYTATSTPSESFSYDADGNMTADGTLTYVWDAENRLIEVRVTSPASGSKQVKYQYDYLSRRVEKKVYTYNTGTSQWNTTPTENLRYVYDQFNLVLVLDGLNSNAVKKKFTWGFDLSGTQHGVGGVGGLLSTEEVGSGSPGYWHFYDGNGNVTQVIDSDNNSLVAHYEYDVFGNTITSSGTYASGNPFRFSTKYIEAENGLYYYGYRYYQARTGRWINRDPIEEAGGINLYGFVNNNPLNGIDVLGLECPDLSDPNNWKDRTKGPKQNAKGVDPSPDGGGGQLPEGGGDGMTTAIGVQGNLFLGTGGTMGTGFYSSPEGVGAYYTAGLGVGMDMSLGAGITNINGGINDFKGDYVNASGSAGPLAGSGHFSPSGKYMGNTVGLTVGDPIGGNMSYTKTFVTPPVKLRPPLILTGFAPGLY